MHDKLAPVTLKLVIILAIIIDDHMTIPDRYTVHVQSLTEAPSHIRLSLISIYDAGFAMHNVD